MANVNQLTNGNGTPGASSQNTASIAPGANRLVLCTVATKINHAIPNTPTLSGGGMTTWTQVFSDTNGVVGGQVMRLTTFRALQTVPTSGVITIDFSGQNQDEILWSVTEFYNVDISGTNGANAVVQTGEVSQNTTSTSGVVNLMPFGNGANSTYGAGVALAVGVLGAGSGFSELSNSSAEANLEVEWQPGNDTTTDWVWASNSFQFLAVAIEIKSLLLESIMI